MPTTALTGSHGVGKTTVFSRIKQLHPEYAFFAEAVRHQVCAFGFGTPLELVDRFGIAAFELWNLNTWSVIDPRVNTELHAQKRIILDRSAVDAYSYYLAMRKTPEDFKLEPLLRGMARHYAALVDRYVYFPTGVFPLVADEMRPDDVEWQMSIDQAVPRAFAALGVPEDRIHFLRSISIEDRVQEVLSLCV